MDRQCRHRAKWRERLERRGKWLNATREVTIDAVTRGRNAIRVVDTGLSGRKLTLGLVRRVSGGVVVCFPGWWP